MQPFFLKEDLVPVGRPEQLRQIMAQSWDVLRTEQREEKEKKRTTMGHVGETGVKINDYQNFV